jgi:hypothetical protein
MFIKCYSQQPRQEKPKCPSTDEWESKVVYTHTHTFTNIIQPMKGHFAVCEKVDEPRRHYAEWNKPDVAKQTLHYLTYL